MSDASRLGAIRYRAAVVPFTTQAKTFAVKSKTDLSDLQGATTFATRLEAEDELKKLSKAEAVKFQVVAKR
jgi:hypothetical protein